MPMAVFNNSFLSLDTSCKSPSTAIGFQRHLFKNRVDGYLQDERVECK